MERWPPSLPPSPLAVVLCPAPLLVLIFLRLDENLNLSSYCQVTQHLSSLEREGMWESFWSRSRVGGQNSARDSYIVIIRPWQFLAVELKVIVKVSRYLLFGHVVRGNNYFKWHFSLCWAHPGFHWCFAFWIDYHCHSSSVYCVNWWQVLSLMKAFR